MPDQPHDRRDGCRRCRACRNAPSNSLLTGVSLVPAPPIGHGLPVILAVCGGLLGFKLWERSKRRCALWDPLPHWRQHDRVYLVVAAPTYVVAVPGVVPRRGPLRCPVTAARCDVRLYPHGIIGLSAGRGRQDKPLRDLRPRPGKYEIIPRKKIRQMAPIDLTRSASCRSKVAHGLSHWPVTVSSYEFRPEGVVIVTVPMRSTRCFVERRPTVRKNRH